MTQFFDVILFYKCFIFLYMFFFFVSKEKFMILIQYDFREVFMDTNDNTNIRICPEKQRNNVELQKRVQEGILFTICLLSVILKLFINYVTKE